MIKQVYVKKNGTVWRLSISAWLGVCNDGARGAGYAFPDECIVQEGIDTDADALTIRIDNWMPIDFKDFIAGYERGDIKPAKPPVVSMAPTDEEIETVVAEFKAEQKPKVKKNRLKK